MHYKLIDEKPKTFVLVFETSDEIAQVLQAFASEQKLASASFKAIGALSSAKLDGSIGKRNNMNRLLIWMSKSN